MPRSLKKKKKNTFKNPSAGKIIFIIIKIRFIILATQSQGALSAGGRLRQGGDWERERGPGPSHVPFIEVGGEAAVPPGCPAAPARAAASAGAAATCTAAAGASAPVHGGHRRRCSRRCRCSRRRRGEVGAALGLGAGGYKPGGRGRLVAGAGGWGGLRALRGGLMDLHVFPQ